MLSPMLVAILLAASAALPVHAQQTVIQIENVRTEYARVLRAPLARQRHLSSSNSPKSQCMDPFRHRPFTFRVR